MPFSKTVAVSGSGLGHQDVVVVQRIAVPCLHVLQQIGPHLGPGQAVGLQTVLGFEVHDRALRDHVGHALGPQLGQCERLIGPAPAEGALLVVAFLGRRCHRCRGSEREGEVPQLGQQFLQAEDGTLGHRERRGDRVGQVLAHGADDAGQPAGDGDGLGGAGHQRAGGLVLQQRRRQGGPLAGDGRGDGGHGAARGQRDRELHRNGGTGRHGGAGGAGRDDGQGRRGAAPRRPRRCWPGRARRPPRPPRR